MVFSLQGERVFPRKSLCLVPVIYFRMPQVLGIRFYSQQVVSKLWFEVGAMTEEDEKTSGIEKFDGTDFGYWKMQIEDFVWYKFATSAHKYDYEEKKKCDDLCQRRFALIKVELF